MLKRFAKRFGFPALLLSAAITLLQPSTAAAAERHGHDGSHDRGDHDRRWHDRDDWRGRDRWEHRQWRPGVGLYFGYTPAPSYVTPAYPYGNYQYANPNCAPQYNYPNYGYPY